MLRYILIIICLLPTTVLGQDSWNQEGDLEDSQVIIEKTERLICRVLIGILRKYQKSR